VFLNVPLYITINKNLGGGIWATLVWRRRKKMEDAKIS
jgi:hypothetical protein